MTTGRSEEEFAAWLARNLLWSALVMLLVGLKLVLSSFLPGLKTPGELALSGGLLLIYTGRIFHLRTVVAERLRAETRVLSG